MNTHICSFTDRAHLVCQGTKIPYTEAFAKITFNGPGSMVHFHFYTPAGDVFLFKIFTPIGYVLL